MKDLKVKILDKLTGEESGPFFWFEIPNYFGVDGLQPLVYTGVTDENGNEVYEGDFVSIHYRCGDIAYEGMDPEERNFELKYGDKPYVVEVTKDFLSNNLCLVSVNSEAKLWFPLEYIKGGRLVNKKLWKIFKNDVKSRES